MPRYGLLSDCARFGGEARHKLRHKLGRKRKKRVKPCLLFAKNWMPQLRHPSVTVTLSLN
jgi:hypothetical protein